MKEIKKQSEGKNYSAVTVGEMNKLNEHVLTFAPGVEIPGKVFVGSALQTTGCDMSFQMFPVGSESGFLHTHKQNEEVYIFIKGEGEFQVDGTVFPIAEGSVVRVSPNGKRSVRNNGKEPLIMICIQYRAGESVGSVNASDGQIIEGKVNW